jgi:hypothetical protein
MILYALSFKVYLDKSRLLNIIELNKVGVVIEILFLNRLILLRGNCKNNGGSLFKILVEKILTLYVAYNTTF